MGKHFIKEKIQDLESIVSYDVDNNVFLDRALEALSNFIHSDDTIFVVNKSNFKNEQTFKNFCRIFKYFGEGFCGTGTYVYDNVYFKVNPWAENGPVLIKKSFEELKKGYDELLVNYTTDKNWLSKPENMDWLKSTENIYDLNILFDKASMKNYQKMVKCALDTLTIGTECYLDSGTSWAKDIF